MAAKLTKAQKADRLKFKILEKFEKLTNGSSTFNLLKEIIDGNDEAAIEKFIARYTDEKLLDELLKHVNNVQNFAAEVNRIRDEYIDLNIESNVVGEGINYDANPVRNISEYTTLNSSSNVEINPDYTFSGLNNFNTSSDGLYNVSGFTTESNSNGGEVIPEAKSESEIERMKNDLNNIVVPVYEKTHDLNEVRRRMDEVGNLSLQIASCTSGVENLPDSAEKTQLISDAASKIAELDEIKSALEDEQYDTYTPSYYSKFFDDAKGIEDRAISDLEQIKAREELNKEYQATLKAINELKKEDIIKELVKQYHVNSLSEDNYQYALKLAREIAENHYNARFLSNLKDFKENLVEVITPDVYDAILKERKQLQEKAELASGPIERPTSISSGVNSEKHAPMSFDNSILDMNVDGLTGRRPEERTLKATEPNSNTEKSGYASERILNEVFKYITEDRLKNNLITKGYMPADIAKVDMDAAITKAYNIARKNGAEITKLLALNKDVPYASVANAVILELIDSFVPSKEEPAKKGSDESHIIRETDEGGRLKGRRDKSADKTEKQTKRNEAKDRDYLARRYHELAGGKKVKAEELTFNAAKISELSGSQLADAKNSVEILLERKKKLDNSRKEKSTLKFSSDVKAIDNVEGELTKYEAEIGKEKIKANLGVKDSETFDIAEEDIENINKLIAGSYKGKESYLKILLGAGFSADQAEAVINNDELSGLAGIDKSGTPNVETCEKRVAENSGLLKVRAEDPTKTDADLEDALVAFYENPETKEYDKNSLKEKVDAIYNDRAKAGVEGITFCLTTNDEIDVNNLDSIEGEINKLINNPKVSDQASGANAETLAGGREIAGVRAVEALIAFKQAQNKKTGETSKEEIEEKREAAKKAIENYKLVNRLEEVAEALAREKKNFTELNADDIAKSTNNKREQIKDKISNIRTLIEEFVEKREVLEDIFGKSEVEKMLQDAQVDAQEISGIIENKELNEAVKTDADRLEEAANKFAEKTGYRSTVFNLDEYNQLLTEKEGNNNKKLEDREIKVSDLIGDKAEVNYKHYYDLKYGKNGKINAYDKTLAAMQKNGGLDALDSNVFDDEWFEKYAMALAVTITSVVSSVSKKEELTVDDAADYAHIMIMVELNSKRLFNALEKVMAPAIYEKFAKLFKHKVDSGDACFNAEQGLSAYNLLVDALIERGISKDNASKIANECKNAGILRMFFVEQEVFEGVDNKELVDKICEAIKNGNSVENVMNGLLNGAGAGRKA